MNAALVALAREVGALERIRAQAETLIEADQSGDPALVATSIRVLRELLLNDGSADAG